MSNVSLYHQSSVNKLGIAAPTGSLLDLQGEESEQTEEELRRKQQVLEFVSKLTPEQVVLQQKRIQVRVTITMNALSASHLMFQCCHGSDNILL